MPQPSSERSDAAAHGIALFELRRGDHVLDLGCGSGRNLGLLLAAVGDAGFVTGLDSDPDALETAASAYRQQIADGRMNLVNGPAESIPVDDASFDAVWSSSVFHHLNDVVVALREIRRVAKPGGRVGVLDGDLGASFPLLPWPLELEDRLRAASWRAAIERYGEHLDYTFDPVIGRNLLRLAFEAGLESPTLHPLTEVDQGLLDHAEQTRISEWFERWFLGRIESYLAPTDYEAARRLLTPDSKESFFSNPWFFLSRTSFLLLCTNPTAA